MVSDQVCWLKSVKGKEDQVRTGHGHSRSGTFCAGEDSSVQNRLGQ